MTITGLVLIGASGLKVHMMLNEPVVGKHFWETWEFMLIQIPLVMGLGIWLVSGLFKLGGWLLGVLALVVFLGDTIYKAVTGAESCGCFGSVDVDPWVTLFAFNIPFLAAMLIFRPRGEKLLGPPWPSAKHFWSVAIPTAILLPAIVIVMAVNKVEPQVVDLTGAISKANANPKTPQIQDPVDSSQTFTTNPSQRPLQDSDKTQGAKQTEPATGKTVDAQIAETQTPPAGEKEPEKTQAADSSDDNGQALPEAVGEDVDDGQQTGKTSEDNEQVEPAGETQKANAADGEDDGSDDDDETAAADSEKPWPDPLKLDDQQEALLNDVLTYVDIYADYKEGPAVFFFYHLTCPTCRELLPEYSAGINELGDNPINLSFIEIPHGKSEKESPVPEDNICPTGVLTAREDGKEWVIGTPLVVVAMDGKVDKAWQLEAPGFYELLDAIFAE